MVMVKKLFVFIACPLYYIFKSFQMLRYRNSYCEHWSSIVWNFYFLWHQHTKAPPPIGITSIICPSVYHAFLSLAPHAFYGILVQLLMSLEWNSGVSRFCHVSLWQIKFISGSNFLTIGDSNMMLGILTQPMKPFYKIQREITVTFDLLSEHKR